LIFFLLGKHKKSTRDRTASWRAKIWNSASAKSFQAGFDDLIQFFKRLPNPDKQFAVMAGIAHASFQQKNYLSVYHILHAFFTQPEPVYRG
jgi:hypothetical protein